MRRVPTTVEPKVPIKRHVKRIRSLVFGLVLKAFASGICVFGVRNRVPADLQIGQIFSDVCLCVRIFFPDHFWTRSMAQQSAGTRKNHSKRGFWSEVRHRTGPLLGPPPYPRPPSSPPTMARVLKLRLRRNLPRGFILVFCIVKVCC